MRKPLSNMKDTAAYDINVEKDSEQLEGAHAKSELKMGGDEAASPSEKPCSESGSINPESNILKRTEAECINGRKQPLDHIKAEEADVWGTPEKLFSSDDYELRSVDNFSSDSSIDDEEKPQLKRVKYAVEQKPLKAYEEFLKQQDLPDNYETSVLYQVFTDLLLIRRWTHVRIGRSYSRNYIAGTAPAAFDSVFPGRGDEEELDRTQVIVPVPASIELSPLQLENLCGECVHPETGKRLRCITMAIVDDDSTTAYYRIFDKWEEIVHPQWKMMKKRKEEEGAGTEERTGKETEEDADSEDSDVDSDCE